MTKSDDARLMAAAIALTRRGRGRTAPNPNVGCIITNAGHIVGRGWTQSGGRPHAEAVALAQAGESAAGATAYVALEPCAHESTRGPACTTSLIEARIARVVVALTDPDPRTNGKGIERLRAAGISVDMMPSLEIAARQAMAGWLSVVEKGRPYVTLKLATSLDGCLALASGESRWITGPHARAHAHLERAQTDMIVVGHGTWMADSPRLDVRIAGLEERAPQRALLSSRPPPVDWVGLRAPADIASQAGVQTVLVEGGARAAAAFLKAGLVDRLMLYRAPILIGGGLPCLADIGLAALDDAHGRWHRTDTRQLGQDTLDIYDRA